MLLLNFFTFCFTDDGKVIKALNTASPRNNTVETVVVEEIQVLPIGVPVKNLHVVHLDVPHGQRRSERDDKLVVVSDDEIMSIRLQRCTSDRITSCSWVYYKIQHAQWTIAAQLHKEFL